MSILGLVQGMVNGVRGLCNGLGPALFGFIFYLFNVDLNHTSVPSATSLTKIQANQTRISINQHRFASSMLSRDIPGPPFLFGAFLAAIALMFSLLLPNSKFEMNASAHDTRTIEQEARLLELDNDDDGQSTHQQVDWVDKEPPLFSFVFSYAESLRNDPINEFLGGSFFNFVFAYSTETRVFRFVRLVIHFCSKRNQRAKKKQLTRRRYTNTCHRSKKEKYLQERHTRHDKMWVKLILMRRTRRKTLKPSPTNWLGNSDTWLKNHNNTKTHKQRRMMINRR